MKHIKTQRPFISAGYIIATGFHFKMTTCATDVLSSAFVRKPQNIRQFPKSRNFLCPSGNFSFNNSYIAKFYPFVRIASSYSVELRVFLKFQLHTVDVKARDTTF